MCSARRDVHLIRGCILGDPGADSGCKRKSKRAEKYGTKKSKERRDEPLGTMSYQTSSKRSPPSWLLIGARKLLCFFSVAPWTCPRVDCVSAEGAKDSCEASDACSVCRRLIKICIMLARNNGS